MHQNAMFSGIVYLQTDDNSGVISFAPPARSYLDSLIALDFDEENIYNLVSFRLYLKSMILLYFLHVYIIKFLHVILHKKD